MLLKNPANTKKLAITGRASCHVAKALPACFIWPIHTIDPISTANAVNSTIRDNLWCLCIV